MTSVVVAEDECRHFLMLNKRLEELGTKFGDLPVHHGKPIFQCWIDSDVLGVGLWQSAADTATSFLSRMAVVHMVHEARGPLLVLYLTYWH